MSEECYEVSPVHLETQLFSTLEQKTKMNGNQNYFNMVVSSSSRKEVTRTHIDTPIKKALEPILKRWGYRDISKVTPQLRYYELDLKPETMAGDTAGMEVFIKTSDSTDRVLAGFHPFVNKTSLKSFTQPYMELDGYYLTRESSTGDGQLSLAVTYNQELRHFKINFCQQEGTYKVAAKCFDNLHQLFTYYVDHPLKKTRGGEIYLLHPIIKIEDEPHEQAPTPSRPYPVTVDDSYLHNEGGRKESKRPLPPLPGVPPPGDPKPNPPPSKKPQISRQSPELPPADTIPTSLLSFRPLPDLPPTSSSDESTPPIVQKVNKPKNLSSCNSMKALVLPPDQLSPSYPDKPKRNNLATPIPLSPRASPVSNNQNNNCDISPPPPLLPRTEPKPTFKNTPSPSPTPRPNSSQTNSSRPNPSQTNSSRPIPSQTNSSHPPASQTNSSRPIPSQTNSSHPPASQTNSSRPIPSQTNSSHPNPSQTNSSHPPASQTNSSHPIPSQTNSSHPIPSQTNSSHPPASTNTNPGVISGKSRGLNKSNSFKVLGSNSSDNSPAPATQPDNLPPPWQKVYSNTQGRFYFYNTETDVTSWKHPLGPRESFANLKQDSPMEKKPTNSVSSNDICGHGPIRQRSQTSIGGKRPVRKTTSPSSDLFTAGEVTQLAQTESHKRDLHRGAPNHSEVPPKVSKNQTSASKLQQKESHYDILTTHPPSSPITPTSQTSSSNQFSVQRKPINKVNQQQNPSPPSSGKFSEPLNTPPALSKPSPISNGVPTGKPVKCGKYTIPAPPPNMPHAFGVEKTPGSPKSNSFSKSKCMTLPHKSPNSCNNGLIDSIQSFKQNQLKSVTPDRRPLSPIVTDNDNVLSVLKRRLQQRSEFIQDSDQSDSSYEDADW